MAAFGHPGRPARARPLRRGPARRRLDDARRAELAGDGRGAPTSPTGSSPRRGELELAGGLPCYRTYACADGWVALGALEPKFWAGALPRASAATTCSSATSDPAVAARARGRLRARAPAPNGRRSTTSTAAALSRCATSTRRSPPRPSVVEVDAARRHARRCACSARPSRFAHAAGRHAPGPALGAHTDAVLAALGYDARRDRGAARPPAPSPAPASVTAGSFLA